MQVKDVILVNNTNYYSEPYLEKLLATAKASALAEQVGSK